MTTKCSKAIVPSWVKKAWSQLTGNLQYDLRKYSSIFARVVSLMLNLPYNECWKRVLGLCKSSFFDILRKKKCERCEKISSNVKYTSCQPLFSVTSKAMWSMVIPIVIRWSLATVSVPQVRVTIRNYAIASPTNSLHYAICRRSCVNHQNSPII